MPVSSYYPRVQTISVSILTVDPARSRIEAANKEGALIYPLPQQLGGLIVWPKEGQYWTATRQNQNWILQSLVERPDEVAPARALNPGEAKIQADTIVTADGRKAVLVDETNIPDGAALKYNLTDKTWVWSPVPRFIFGIVSSSGGILHPGTDNWSVLHFSTGHYRVAFDDELSTTNYAVDITAHYSGSAGIIANYSNKSTTGFDTYTSSSVLVDAEFSFWIFIPPSG